MKTTLIKSAFLIAFLMGLATVLYCLFPNLTTAAPLLWSTRIGQYEGVRHVTRDAIFCTANISAIWGSENSLTCYDRRTGKKLWERLQKTGAETWQFEQGHVFTDTFCYINTGVFQLRESRIIDPRLVAVNLANGKTTWEVPALGEAGGTTLRDGVLYMVTAKGVVSAYEAKNGRMLWSLDLDEVEHHASYGGIESHGNALLVNCNVSTDYTRHDHARTIILDLRDHRRVGTRARGWIISSQFVSPAATGFLRYDLSAVRATSDGIALPKLTVSLEVRRGSGSLVAAFDETEPIAGPLRLLSPDQTAFVTTSISGRAELMNVTPQTVYFSQRGEVFAVDRRTGKTQWEVSIPGLASVAASEQLATVISTRGILYAFDPRTGRQLWSYRIRNDLGYSTHDGAAVILTNRGKLLYFDSYAMLRDASL